jgi:hypothetical protein
MRAFVRNHALTLVMLGLFALFWFGQSLAGHHFHAEQEREHGRAPGSYGEYIVSPEFIESTFENWESEFLQMGCFVLLSAVLKQRGSSQSKPIEGQAEEDEDPARHRADKDAPGPVRKGGWALKLYSRSLSLALFALFAVSFGLHALGGWRAANQDARLHGSPELGLGQFLLGPQFWYQSLQNWQSEFLSVGVLVLLSVYLRQKGSPESKPVHYGHHRMKS